MGSVEIVLFLLFAVVISGGVSKILPIAIPLPLVQIAIGALIAAIADFKVELSPELFFLLFLPPLLFLDGWRSSKEALAESKWLILLLAMGLVFFTVLVGGALIYWLIPALPLLVSFALAAVLSPTDPIAVAAITERVSIPKRLMHLLEGEALFNDAAGLVSMHMLIVAVVSGYFSFQYAFLLLIWSSLMGLAIGVLVTFAIAYVARLWAERFGAEVGTPTLVSLLIPFAAYLIAEYLNASGILAAVAAGLAMSYAEGPNALASIKVQRNVVWDTVQSAANGIIFVLLGEQLPNIIQSAGIAYLETGYEHTSLLYLAALIIPILLLVLRFIWILFLMAIPSLRIAVKDNKKPAIYVYIQLASILSVAGVRGTITLAGVLTMPFLLDTGAAFPGRNLSIFLAAAVIIISLLIATVALPKILAKANFTLDETDAHEEQLARIMAAEAAIASLEKNLAATSNRSMSDAYSQASLRVLEDYRRRIERYRGDEDNKKFLTYLHEYEDKLRLLALKAERRAYFSLNKEKKISEEAMNKLVREIDLLETRSLK